MKVRKNILEMNVTTELPFSVHFQTVTMGLIHSVFLQTLEINYFIKIKFATHLINDSVTDTRE